MTTLAPPLRKPPRPSVLCLSVYAFDPTLAVANDTAAVAFDTVKLNWPLDCDAPIGPGPRGEYIEVIDVDPGSGAWYYPVDLEDRYLLAQQGYPPSDSNPQFHQQMVFAVAMRTIGLFETALGRRILWAERRDFPAGTSPADRERQRYVQRLRIYPHALRGAENAFYSPARKALMLGYYQASALDDRSVPGAWVFAAVSHDVIAHETTHAILDGINPHLIDKAHCDSLALHEGFADVVALLQHFSMTAAVKAEIAKAPDRLLDAPSLLSGIAFQFGRATRRDRKGLPPGPLRDAVSPPEPGFVDTAVEAHDRGARLLAAVYAAFLDVYGVAAEQLLAMTGVPAPGAPAQPQLINALAELADTAGRRLLKMVIRALDFLPPSSASFSEFLRALVTADADLYPVDSGGYRRALIMAFRRYGAITGGVRSLSTEDIAWPRFMPPPLPGARAGKSRPIKGIDQATLFDRHAIFEQSRHNAVKIHHWLFPERAGLPVDGRDLRRGLGLSVDPLVPASLRVRRDGADPLPQRTADDEISTEVNVRFCRKVGEGGTGVRQMIVQVLQKRYGYFDTSRQSEVDAGTIAPPPADFILRGGVTLVFDLLSGSQDPGLADLRYAIEQPLDDRRLDALRAYLTGRSSVSTGGDEPIAQLHAEMSNAY